MNSEASSSTLARLVLKIGISTAGTLVIIQCLRKLFPSKSKQIQRYLFTQIAMKFSANEISSSLAPFKEKLFSHMTNDDVNILEIGIGHGSNLLYYPSGSKLYSVEPNAYFEKYFKQNIQKFPGISVEEFINGTAEDMSMIKDSSMDVVVSTHVLCSVTNMASSLNEIIRVLKPGGKFYYIEHIAFDSTKSPIWSFIQRLSEPFWQLVSDGCKLTRNPSQVMNTLPATADGYTLMQMQEDTVLVEGVYSVMKLHIIGIRRKELLKKTI